MLRLDPETMLILLITTRIPGRFYLTGTVAGPCSVDDLRSCAVTVTSTVKTKPLVPVLDIIETEDNKRLLPHIDRSQFRRGNFWSFELAPALNRLLFDLITESSDLQGTGKLQQFGKSTTRAFCHLRLILIRS